MKKTIVLIFAVVLSVSAFAQTKSKDKTLAKPADTTAVKPAPVKNTLTVELSPQDWEFVLGILNQSNAPHQQVVVAQSALMQQLQTQLQKLLAQQKQPADTSAKK